MMPRRRPALFTAPALCLLLAVLAGPGCATSRYDELRARSREVERKLEDERDGLLASPDSADSAGRLDHLSSLRASLSAVDIGLSAARYTLDDRLRPVAYDAIEEAYGTIEWNIPLGPGDRLRALPPAFSGGRFDKSLLIAE